MEHERVAYNIREVHTLALSYLRCYPNGVPVPASDYAPPALHSSAHE